MTPKIKPRDDNGRLCIGVKDSSFGRLVYLVNPEDASWTKHRFIMWFGAYGSTNLSIWSNSLDDAIETAGEYIAKHWPGMIMKDWGDEHKELVREACTESGVDFPAGFDALEDEAKWKICETAEADLTRTESGFLTSYEWGLNLEDPSRAELDEFLYPKGIDWTIERSE